MARVMLLNGVVERKNGVVERKNQVIQEMARVMLQKKQIRQKFWGEAVNTSCHIGNRIFF